MHIRGSMSLGLELRRPALWPLGVHRGLDQCPLSLSLPPPTPGDERMDSRYRSLAGAGGGGWCVRPSAESSCCSSASQLSMEQWDCGQVALPV